MDLCINCGIATSRCKTLGRRALHDEKTLSVIRQWLAPQAVNSSDHVCQACWDLAQTPHVIGEPRQLGHCSVCLRCGCSLASRVSHPLHTGSTREMAIYNVIQGWIIPRTVEVESRICHNCWVAADRAAVRMASVSSTFSLASTFIVLPDYMRAIETESRCFIEGCQSTQRNRVPLSTRKMLLTQCKYYVPESNRICDQHLAFEDWNFIEGLRNNCLQTFTAKHIQDMLSLKDVVNP